MQKNVFKLPVSFASSDPDKWWANFSSAKNLILQKTLSGIDKVLNFKDFSRPNRVTESKDFLTRLLKIQDLFKIVQATG